MIFDLILLVIFKYNKLFFYTLIIFGINDWPLALGERYEAMGDHKK